MPKAVPRAPAVPPAMARLCSQWPTGLVSWRKAPLCRARVEQWLSSYRVPLSMFARLGLQARGCNGCCSGTDRGVCTLHHGQVCPDTECSWALLCSARRWLKEEELGAALMARTWSEVAVPNTQCLRAVVKGSEPWVPVSGRVWFVQPL